MHFLKTPLFHYALLQKAEPNSPLIKEDYLLKRLWSKNDQVGSEEQS